MAVGVQVARTEFGQEILRCFDGSRWLWNEGQSWLEFIPFNKVMPAFTKPLAPVRNNLLEAVVSACLQEAARVGNLQKLQEAD